MPFIIDAGIWSSVFAVPTVVVDQHIKLCSPLSLKILLMMLRHAGTPVDAAWLSEKLNLPAADISDALNYWLCADVISSTDSPVAADGHPPAAPACTVSPSSAAPALTVCETQDAETGQKVTTLSVRPKISRTDIAQMAQESPSLSSLLREAQQVLGEPLTPVDSEILASLFGYYKFDPGVILMMLQYCVSIGKPSMRYLEKIAASWNDLNIRSYEQAELEIVRLTQNNDNEKRVLRAFRMQGRGLSARERQYVDEWFALGLDERLIALACEATLDKTGKVSFSYAAKILSSWTEKKINTVQLAMENLKSPGKKSAPQNKAAQTSGSSIDKKELSDLIHQQFSYRED